jgi:formate dehydrogenase assembly factor FdhD
MLGLVLVITPASAQDVRGLEVCTAEKDMARRTSCLQANVEFLQQELVKLRRAAQDDKTAAAKEVAALKADLAALKATLEKTQGELAELKKPKPASQEKK